MKIQAKNTIQLLFYMSVLSIFIINSNVYPIIFGLFVVGTSIIFLYNHEYKIKKWTLVILGFLLWSVIIFIIQNEYTSDNFKMLFKMIINLLFFFTVLNSSEKIVDELFWKRLKIVFEIIIIISFVQYIFLYYKLNLFSLVLNTSDSMTAYRITENPQLLFWGTIQKIF